MEIIKDIKIRKKWHKGFRRNLLCRKRNRVKTIVLHGTGGGGTYNWVLDGGRSVLYKKGVALFHYLIERRGKTIEIIDPDRWVYHSSSGEKDKETIGIELLNPGALNSRLYTGFQYTALWELIFDELFNRYNIINIVSHNYMKEKYSGGKKECPGDGFAWVALLSELYTRGYVYEREGEEAFLNIKKREV
jgi:N-acetyl-anhydromuramyl-L-alanine amidase AmpD